MSLKYNDTGYMYSSARIRALETKMLGREACERLLTAGSSDEIIQMLSDFGYEIIKKQNGTIDREATLMSAISAAFEDVAQILPSPGLVKLFQYKYDCNNIKAAIKARARGIDPMGMMYPLGCVIPEAVIEAVEAQNYDILPSHMAAAAHEAAEGYLRTKNPQLIDFILDRAAFADMLEAATETGVPFVIGYIKTVIDLTNIQMCIRVLRMKAGNTGGGLLGSALIFGGRLEGDRLLELYEKGEAGLIGELVSSHYSGFAHAIAEKSSAAQIERAADIFIMNIVKEVKWKPFGAELAAAYLIALEYGLKNVRIIMAGKEAGLSDSAIRERMREMYV